MRAFRFVATAAAAFGCMAPALALQCVMEVRKSPPFRQAPVLSQSSESGWLVGMQALVFRYTGGRLESVEAEADTYNEDVVSISGASVGTRLILTRSGLLRYAGGRLSQVSGSPARMDVDRIMDPIDGVWLILTLGGLIEYRDGRLIPVPDSGREVGRDRAITPIPGAWLVATRSGLAHFGGGRLVAVPGGSREEIGLVLGFGGRIAGGWLVGAEQGLFLYAGNRLIQIPGGLMPGIGANPVAKGPVNGEWLVAGGGNLFSYSRGALTRVADVPGQPVQSSAVISDPVAGGWLVSTLNRGVLRYAQGRLTPVPGGATAGAGGFRGFSQAVGQAMLVDGGEGLFLYREGRLTPVRGSDSDTVGGRPYYGERFVNTESRGGGWLVAGQNGLFRYVDNRLVRVPGSDETRSGGVEGITDAVNGIRLIAGNNGLYRYVERPAVRARPSRANPTEIESGQPTYVGWDLVGDCAEYGTSADFLLSTDRGSAQAAPLNYDAARKTVTLALTAETIPFGRTLMLYAVDANGRAYPISEELSLRASLGWATLAALLAKLALLAHSIFFLGLIIAARWFDRAAAMLLHPMSRSIGLWFGWALTFFPVLQLWLLGRWFDARKAKLDLRPVHPLPVTSRATGTTISSVELAGKLHPGCRLWLEGKPGMGKTTVAREIEERFFAEARTLSRALRKLGYIPLFVRLRDLAGADLRKGDRMWPARVAEAVLGGQGFIVDEGVAGANLSFVAAILKRSRFVLLLDGANEVPWDKEILSAAAATDRPGLLVTSQMTPFEASEQFDCYSLPETMEGAVEPLLKLFLGKEEGGRLFRELAGSPLIAEIKSGYDVRLVESLHRSGAGRLPETRVALYDTIIATLFTADRAGSTPDRLYAFAWQMWLRGERQFTGEELDRPLLDALRGPGMPVVRMLEGEALEFRHDQMRGYLAARHIMAAVNPLGVLEKSEAQWPPARSEQDLVWQFLCEIVDDDAMARRIYLWTLDKPDDRVALQAAFRTRVEVPNAG